MALAKSFGSCVIAGLLQIKEAIRLAKSSEYPCITLLSNYLEVVRLSSQLESQILDLFFGKISNKNDQKI